MYRVLHILGSARPEATGITRIVAALSKGLDVSRYRLHAWFLASGGPLEDELRSAGIEVLVCPWGGIHDPIGALRFAWALQQGKVSIVHQHFGGRSVRWLLRGMTSAHVIAHLHGTVVEANGHNPAPILSQGADAVIATSHDVAKHAAGPTPHIVYPGVDVSDYRDRSLNPLDRKVIGTAGRLAPIKGTIFLVRAFALLLPEFPDAHLEIAGSGPESDVLEREVNKIGIQRHVSFLGWHSNLDSIFARWDIFAQASLSEGFGIAALEAMAAGLPVVATSVGGVPELILDGHTGWLVPPADPTAMAHRLRSLLIDPRQRRAMGAAGRAHVHLNFSRERMVRSIAHIYDDLMKTQH